MSYGIKAARTEIPIKFKEIDSAHQNGRIEITVTKKEAAKWDIFSRISTEAKARVNISLNSSSELVVTIRGMAGAIFKAPVSASFVVPCESATEVVRTGDVVTVVVTNWAGKDMIFAANPKKWVR